MTFAGRSPRARLCARRCRTPISSRSTIGHNDPPWNSFHDPCDGKEGYPHAGWAKYRGPCLSKTAGAFERNLHVILSTIVALRRGRPTAIRLTNDYNDLIGDPAVPRSAYPIVKSVFDLFTSIPCRLAAQAHAVCVDTYHAFNGPRGVENAGSLLAPDHTHPNQRGHQLIAQLLVESGLSQLLR